MDFQRLFKRKAEGSALPGETDDAAGALKNVDVVIREGELLEGNFPASLLWNSVGGGITIKAGKILGILEGRTRIKAGVLQVVRPTCLGLFTVVHRTPIDAALSIAKYEKR